jgi:hypothetical protein
MVSACSKAPAATPAPTAAPATSAPPAATEPPTAGSNQVSANGISLTIPAGLGTDITASIVPAVLEGPGAMPAYVDIKLQGYPLSYPQEGNEAEIQVMRATDYINANPGGAIAMSMLNDLVFHDALLTVENVPTTGLVTTNLSKLSLQNVDGVRMLSTTTRIGFMGPIANPIMVYRFYGETQDRMWYVFINLPIATNFLPASMETATAPNPGDEYKAYVSQIAMQLEEAGQKDAISPTLAQLDALVQSVRIDPAVLANLPTVPPPPQAATPTPTTNPAACSDAVTFVSDVTIPDNTVVGSGEAFTKTWKVKNAGNCTWDSAYKLVFIRGEQMGGTSPADVISSSVQPGNEMDLSVKLNAPSTNGSHWGVWQIYNDAGKPVLKADGKPQELSVVINITNGRGGNVVSVRGWSYTFTGTKCSNAVQYEITASINTDGPVNVKYTWSVTNGVLSVISQNYVFDSAGSLAVLTQINAPFADPKDVKVTLTANGVSSSFTICP